MKKKNPRPMQARRRTRSARPITAISTSRWSPAMATDAADITGNGFETHTPTGRCCTTRQTNCPTIIGVLRPIAPRVRARLSHSLDQGSGCGLVARTGRGRCALFRLRFLSRSAPPVQSAGPILVDVRTRAVRRITALRSARESAAAPASSPQHVGTRPIRTDVPGSFLYGRTVIARGNGADRRA